MFFFLLVTLFCDNFFAENGSDLKFAVGAAVDGKSSVF